MIELTNLTKAYGRGNQRTLVLDDITFRVDAGEILAVVGPSGAGKSTLAQCINLLTPPTSGSVVVNGEDLTTLSARQLRVARRRIGTVFQSAGLLERRTAAENVALPLEYLGVTADESKKRVAELLDRVACRSVPTTIRSSSPVASANASASPGRSRCGPRSYCPTRPPPAGASSPPPTRTSRRFRTSISST